MNCRVSVIVVALLGSRACAAGLSKAEIAKLDGQIMVPNQLDSTIYIFPSNKSTWTSADALWSYKLKKGKDRLKYDYPKLDDVKRVVNSKGEVCLLITGNHGTSYGGISLYNMDKGYFEYSALPRSGFHSADLLSDGNMVVADPENYLLLMSPTSDEPKQSLSVNVHSAVWDRANEVVWAFGGSSMHKYSYEHGTLTLQCSFKPKSAWVQGGHDMSAMNTDNKLVFTCNSAIGTFDMSKASCKDHSSEAPWAILYDKDSVHGDKNIASGKGVHYNHITKQLAYSHPDRPAHSYPSFRTYQVRNPAKTTSKGMQTSHLYKPNTGMAFRIARWFIDSPFSYAPSSLSLTPATSDVTSGTSPTKKSEVAFV